MTPLPNLAFISLCLLTIVVYTNGSFTNTSLIAAGRTYRIRNRHSGLYVGTVGFSIANSARMEQNLLQTDKNRASQIWNVFPLDNGYYFIVNKLSGIYLTTPGASKDRNGGMEQFSDHRAPIWLIRPDREGYYTIQYHLSPFYVSVESRSKNKGARITTWDLEEGTQRESQQWSFEVEEEYPAVLEAENVNNLEENDIGDVPRLTTWLPPGSFRTENVLIGQVALPFTLIKDPALNLQQQSAINPYYLLRRYGYWQMVNFHEHSGASQTTRSVTVPVGLHTNHPGDLDAISISVDTDGLFVVDGKKVPMMRSKINKRLKIGAEAQGLNVSHKTPGATVQLELKFVSSIRQSEAIWFRHDYFVLERIDGEIIMKSNFRNPAIYISDCFRGHKTVFP